MKVVVPPEKCRDTGGLVRVLGKRRHEGQIDVDMRINESGKNPLPSGVDDFRVRRNREIGANPGDGLIFGVNLGFVASIRGYDLAVTNQEAHTNLC